MSLLDSVRTVVVAHAHPDDETLATGALLARLVQDGVQVHLVTATRGERGEVVGGPRAHLSGSAALVAQRERELACALEVLGVRHHVFLGDRPARADGLPPRRYLDSGMRWVTPTLAGPGEDAGEQSLTAATVDEAAGDLAAYLVAVGPDALLGYEATGGYGHPDHVQMHHVAVAAGRATGVPMLEVVPPGGVAQEWLDLDDQLATVLRALRCHATQLTVDGTDLVHSGGQRHPVVTRTGLRPSGG